MDSLREEPQSVQRQSPAPLSFQRAGHRSVVADIIAQALFSQHCREQGFIMRLQDAPVEVAKKFREVGEFAVQFALHEDLERTAVMAAADVICAGSYGDNEMSITDDLADKTAAHYFNLADVAVRAYRQTLVFQSPDARKDADYCRLLDALEQKGLVKQS